MSFVTAFLGAIGNIFSSSPLMLALLGVVGVLLGWGIYYLVGWITSLI